MSINPWKRKGTAQPVTSPRPNRIVASARRRNTLAGRHRRPHRPREPCSRISTATQPVSAAEISNLPHANGSSILRSAQKGAPTDGVCGPSSPTNPATPRRKQTPPVLGAQPSDVTMQEHLEYGPESLAGPSPLAGEEEDAVTAAPSVAIPDKTTAQSQNIAKPTRSGPPIASRTSKSSGQAASCARRNRATENLTPQAPETLSCRCVRRQPQIRL